MAQRRDAAPKIDREKILARARGWACYLGVIRVQPPEVGEELRSAVQTMDARELRALAKEYPDAPSHVSRQLLGALDELDAA